MRSHRRRTDPLIHYVWRTICCIYQSVCFIPHLSAFILQKCWLKYFKMCTRMFKNVHWGIVCKNGQRERGTAYISSSRAVGWDALESYHAVLATNKKMKWFSIDSGRLLNLWLLVGLPSRLNGEESTCQCRRCRRRGFDPWVGTISWGRKWQPMTVFLPGKFHGQRSLAGYSPWGHNESDTT